MSNFPNIRVLKDESGVSDLDENLVKTTKEFANELFKTKMRILVFSQYYYPEPFRISDITEELVKRGHEVTVVTGLPDYPAGDIYAGYEKPRVEVINGVTVYRVKTIARKKNPVNRILNYLSYVYLAKKLAKKLGNNFDVVFVNVLTPVFQGIPANYFAKKHDLKVVHYCMDLSPASFLMVGIEIDGLIYKYLKRVSLKIYQNSSKILVSSEGFIDYLHGYLGIEREKLDYLPQYANEPVHESDIRTFYEDKEVLDLVFTGNVGKAQNLKPLIDAVRCLRGRLNLHIIGDGSELENLKEYAQEIKAINIKFYGRLPLNELSNYQYIADAMYVGLIDLPGIRLTLPGKVQSYMKAGKPIIANLYGETTKVIEESKCGLVVKDSIYRTLDAFCRTSAEERSRMAKNSRKYYEENFTKEMFIEKLEQVFEETRK